MIYLESVKIENFTQTFSHGITLELKENVCHYICSNNKEKIHSIYYLLKQKKNYLNGNILINNIDITKLDKNNLDNFYYENVAFCEKNIIFNNKITCYEYLKIVKNLSKNHSIKINKFLKPLDFNSKFLNTKINKLSSLLKTKLIIISGLIKNVEYILIKLDDFNLNDSQTLEIKTICNQIAKIYKKTILIFNVDNNNINETISLEDEKNYVFNNRLTIYDNNKNFQGYKLIQHHFNIFTISIKYSYKIYLIYVFLTFLLMIGTIFILTILNQKEITNDSTWLQFINKNQVYFYVLGYSLFVINCILQGIISFFWYKNNKKYLLFLSTMNIHNLWISLLIPILLILNTFIIITFSYLINILILDNLDIKYNINIWNTSLYTNLVYIIETFLISYLLILRINNISKFYKVFIDFPNN